MDNNGVFKTLQALGKIHPDLTTTKERLVRETGYTTNTMGSYLAKLGRERLVWSSSKGIYKITPEGRKVLELGDPNLIPNTTSNSANKNILVIKFDQEEFLGRVGNIIETIDAQMTDELREVVIKYYPMFVAAWLVATNNHEKLMKDIITKDCTYNEYEQIELAQLANTVITRIIEIPQEIKDGEELIANEDTED